MRHIRGADTALLSFSLVAAIGCGGGGYSTGPQAGQKPGGSMGAPNSVTVSNNAFTPGDLTVSAGTTVTWTWNSCTGGDGYGAGQTCVSHNVTFDQGPPNSVTQSSGTFTRTFAVAGTYPYHCTIHGTAMSGRVLVR